MTILAIDPGSELSAWVLFDGARVLYHGITENGEMRDFVRGSAAAHQMDITVIEEITSYGMPVGREVFDTVRWTGRFQEAGRGERCELLPRRDVKLHLCQSARAKDANVRQALLERFGGEKAAKGNKAAPGPLYGLRKDEWAALAIAVTWWDLHCVSSIEEALAL